MSARIIAVLLSSCLIANPAAASGSYVLSQASYRQTPDVLFQSQALSLAVSDMHEPLHISARIQVLTMKKTYADGRKRYATNPARRARHKARYIRLMEKNPKLLHQERDRDLFWRAQAEKESWDEDVTDRLIELYDAPRAEFLPLTFWSLEKIRSAHDRPSTYKAPFDHQARIIRGRTKVSFIFAFLSPNLLVLTLLLILVGPKLDSILINHFLEFTKTAFIEITSETIALGLAFFWGRRMNLKLHFLWNLHHPYTALTFGKPAATTPARQLILDFFLHWGDSYQNSKQDIRTGPDLFAFNLDENESGLPGETRNWVNTFYDSTLGATVYQAAPWGKFVMVKVPDQKEAPEAAILSLDHATCTASLIRAVDPTGQVWIGHAHLHPNDTDGAGVKGKAFEQYIRVLKFLKEKHFTSIQVQRIVIKDEVLGMPPDSDVQKAEQTLGVASLPTIEVDGQDNLHTVNTKEWFAFARAPFSTSITEAEVRAWPTTASKPGMPASAHPIDPTHRAA